jgi:magnesium transporter
MKSRKKNPHHTGPEKIGKEKRVSGKTGLPPGTLVHIGKIFTEKVSVNLTEYNPDVLNRVGIHDPGGLSIPKDSINRWIEVKGLQDTLLVESIGKLLHISPLVLEDIVNTEHRPKFEIQDDMVFITMKAFYLSPEKQIINEQASFILGKGFLLSFQESDNTIFEPIRLLLENPGNKLRSRGLDYLLYSLIDAVVDQYYEVMEFISDQLEDLEDLIFERPSQELIDKNRFIKKDIITIRKALVPELEAISTLKRDEPELIGKEAMRYFGDIHDHIIQSLDHIDTYRELSAELKENYLSNLTLRMNQVMKLLTIITTIFIPLTFIVGIYGMNFENMPELTWKYGYFIVLAIMFVITGGMMIYFRKKKWI